MYQTAISNGLLKNPEEKASTVFSTKIPTKKLNSNLILKIILTSVLLRVLQ